MYCYFSYRYNSFTLNTVSIWMFHEYILKLDILKSEDYFRKDSNPLHCREWFDVNISSKISIWNMQAERNKIECLIQYGLFHSLFFIFISVFLISSYSFWSILFCWMGVIRLVSLPCPYKNPQSIIERFLPIFWPACDAPSLYPACKPIWASLPWRFSSSETRNICSLILLFFHLLLVQISELYWSVCLNFQSFLLADSIEEKLLFLEKT